METIINQTYDEERSLYNLKNTIVKDCIFRGPKDGESVLKEARNIVVDNSKFSLRYAMWHVEGFKLLNSKMDELTRAPIWYASNGEIINSNLTCIKAVRECSNISIKDSIINSDEFGWKCNNITLTNTKLNSVYVFFDSNNVKLNNIEFSGKYSFQYMNDLTIENSYLDTKDAFWHSNNVTVKNSVLKGEYLAWFSNNLTLINCKIIGTQPLCYCKNLKLIDCEMINTDLSFEYSDVEATIIGEIESVKNPHSGYIKATSIKEIILNDSIMDNNCKIITND